jgi:hypothetical protein
MIPDDVRKLSYGILALMAVLSLKKASMEQLAISKIA